MDLDAYRKACEDVGRYATELVMCTDRLCDAEIALIKAREEHAAAKDAADTARQNLEAQLRTVDVIRQQTLVPR